MKPLKVIGLNSGTSMDGVDAAIFEIRPTEQPPHFEQFKIPALKAEMLGSILFPFEPNFQRQLQKTLAKGNSTLEEICRLNVALGEVFAQSAAALMKTCKLSLTDVDLIGSHGQTIWHSPASKQFWGVSCQGSLQLGEPSVIAERTGVPVIADFRAADLAAGGQGAPLVAFADQVFFGANSKATGVLNIGGIANITVINGNGEAKLAFDTGPGNMLVDRAARLLFDCEFDEDGKLAKQGQIDQAWLAELLNHPYFHRRPPKTTGREDFGYTQADRLLVEAQRRGLSAHDCIATLTGLTARSVTQAYSTFIQPVVKLDRLVLGGGGADNRALVEQLKEFWPHAIQIHRHEDFGISTKFKESLLFALLAYTSYFGIPNNVPLCTGARRRVCLGKLCNPQRL
jgi:anhydro-N-acetylmuramic acid kinase